MTEWKLEEEYLVLNYKNLGDVYEIDLNEARSSAQVLDWIMQVEMKDLADDEILSSLVRELARILNPQAHLCGSGRSRTITRQKLVQLCKVAKEEKVK